MRPQARIMMKNYNKPTRKKLRELTGIAYERELAKALKKLHEQFNNWQAKNIDTFELNDLIHQFHQKTSREIWKLYNYAGHNDMLVARALKLGFLTKDEIGKELVERLEPMINYWQDDDSDEK